MHDRDHIRLPLAQLRKAPRLLIVACWRATPPAPKERRVEPRAEPERRTTRDIDGEAGLLSAGGKVPAPENGAGVIAVVGGVEHDGRGGLRGVVGRLVVGRRPLRVGVRGLNLGERVRRFPGQGLQVRQSDVGKHCGLASRESTVRRLLRAEARAVECDLAGRGGWSDDLEAGGVVQVACDGECASGGGDRADEVATLDEDRVGLAEESVCAGCGWVDRPEGVCGRTVWACGLGNSQGRGGRNIPTK
jgi:hypothetical protein